MRRWIPLVVPTVVLAGCVSLTSAGRLKEAQRFADDVTSAYDVPRVEVVIDESNYEGIAVYNFRDRRITFRSTDLNAANVRLLRLRMVPLVARATIRTRPWSVSDTQQEEQRLLLEENVRGVEIVVKFLGMSTHQAVKGYAEYFVEISKRTPPNDQRLHYRLYRRVSPCDELRDVWSYFVMTDPLPACGAALK